MKFLAVLCFLCLLLVNCGHEDEPKGHLEQYSKDSELIDSLLNRKTLNLINRKTPYSENKTRVLVLLRGSCFSCFKELEKWEHEYKKNDLLKKSNLIAWIHGKMDYMFEAEIITRNKFSFPIYLDTTENLPNSYTNLFAERAVILDNKNKLLFIGSPIKYPKLERAFYEILENN